MDKNFIIGVFFFVAAIVVVVVLAYPQFQMVLASSRLVDEKQQEYLDQLMLVQEIHRIASEYGKIKKKISQFDALMPVFGPKSIAELFTEFEMITSRGGVLLNNISFSSVSPVSGKNYKVVNAHLSVSADYRTLKNFLRLLEQNQHLMDIVSISVRKASEGNVSGSIESAAGNKSSNLSGVGQDKIFSFNMRVRVYYR